MDARTTKLGDLSLGILPKSDGSSRLCNCSSMVTVAVQGPSESRQQVEVGSEANLLVYYRSVEVRPSVPNDNVCVANIKKVLDSVVIKTLFPRAVISITIHEGAFGGSYLSTVINACYVALIDAGVPMRQSIVSVTVAIPQSDQEARVDKIQTIVNPNKEEEADAESVFVFAIGMPSKRELFCHAWGIFTPQKYQLCLETALGEVDDILTSFRNVFSKKLSDLKFC